MKILYKNQQNEDSNSVKTELFERSKPVDLVIPAPGQSSLNSKMKKAFKNFSLKAFVLTNGALVGFD
jgi:hypothetical protein